MNTILDILLIQILICYLIDLSGFIPSLERGLGKILKYRVSIPRPFSCSLCMGWWLGLIYLLVSGHFILNYIVTVALVSFFSKNISGFLRWIQEVLTKIEQVLYKLID